MIIHELLVTYDEGGKYEIDYCCPGTTGTRCNHAAKDGEDDGKDDLDQTPAEPGKQVLWFAPLKRRYDEQNHADEIDNVDDDVCYDQTERNVI